MLPNIIQRREISTKVASENGTRDVSDRVDLDQFGGMFEIALVAIDLPGWRVIAIRSRRIILLPVSSGRRILSDGTNISSSIAHGQIFELRAVEGVVAGLERDDCDVDIIL